MAGPPPTRPTRKSRRSRERNDRVDIDRVLLCDRAGLGAEELGRGRRPGCEVDYWSSSSLRLLRLDSPRSEREDREPREAEDERSERDDSAREDDRDDREVDRDRERFTDRERSNENGSARSEKPTVSDSGGPQFSVRWDSRRSCRRRFRFCS
jgi:hypothetical protein